MKRIYEQNIPLYQDVNTSNWVKRRRNRKLTLILKQLELPVITRTQLVRGCTVPHSINKDLTSLRTHLQLLQADTNRRLLWLELIHTEKNDSWTDWCETSRLWFHLVFPRPKSINASFNPRILSDNKRAKNINQRGISKSQLNPNPYTGKRKSCE